MHDPPAESVDPRGRDLFDDRDGSNGSCIAATDISRLEPKKCMTSFGSTRAVRATARIVARS